jgi:hypothetical protein
VGLAVVEVTLLISILEIGISGVMCVMEKVGLICGQIVDTWAVFFSSYKIPFSVEIAF